MKDIEQLKRQLAAKKEEARALYETENRSTEQSAQLDSLLTECENRQKEIETEERAQHIMMKTKQENQQGDVDERGAGFSNLGEFVRAVVYNPNDDRLVEARAQNMGTGSEGGVLVPTLFRDQMMTITPQDAIFRPRATVIPADPEHPDAGVTMPALDYSGGNDVYAGVTVEWIGEGEEKPQTTASFTDVSLEPNEVAGHIVVTDKLLRNSAAADVTLRGLLRRAILAAEDDKFYNGTGVGTPLGIVNAPATIGVNRGTASQIHYDDLVGMYAKAKMGGPMVWTASQSIIPQLMQIKDGDGRLIWQPNASQESPGTIFGVPLRWNERNPQLGTKGDLGLMDLDYYLIKDGAPLAISASEHVHFTRNKTVIKAFWNVDGQPWLKDKLTQENGYEVSPFVVLDAPSG